MTRPTGEQLRHENESLKARLHEAEETLRAIRAGEVEALVIESPQGPRVYSLEGVNHSYRMLVEKMSEGAASLNEAGIVLYANTKFAAMLEVPLEQLMGSSIFDYTPSTHVLTVKALLREATQREARAQVSISTGSGQEIPAQLSISVAEQAGIRTYCTVVTDLRSQKHLEEIVASERLARSVIEQATYAIVVCDAQGRIIKASPNATELCGTNPLLESFDRAFAIEWSPDGKNDSVHGRGIAETSLRGGVVHAAPAFLTKPDGSRFEVVVSAGALRGSSGQIVGSLISLIDVSQLKRTEKALALLTRLYSVLSQVNEAIVRTRDEQSLFEDACRIIAEQGDYALVWIGLVNGDEIAPAASQGPHSDYLNEIKVALRGEFGTGPTGTCVREHRPVINSDFVTNPDTGPWRVAALARGIRSSAAFPLRRRNIVVGALTLYSANVAAFDSDHVKLLSALCDDISYALDALEKDRLRTEAEDALRKSELSLREANNRKNAFLATLSHELRNPLAPLQNSVYILERTEPEGEQAIRARSIIGRQVNQLTRLVDDLLDVTRITSGKLRLQRARFDLAQTIRRVADDHRTTFCNAGIHFDVETNVEPLWIEGDEHRVAQMVGNLLVNAAKFTPPAGRVLLVVDEDRGSDSHATIRVRDTGIGISPETLPKLFEAFSQADDSLDRSKGGLGLGLAIVKGLVQMHGGSVEVHSSGQGDGTEFVVRLPSQSRSQVNERTKPSSMPPSSCKILVIEDNADAAETLKEVLELNTHVVSVARSGPEGVEKAREFNPDVVLCDIGLPGMNGYQVAEAFRGDEMLVHTWLVAVTGYAQPEDLRRALAAGFDRHIRKPLSLDEIHEVLASRHSREKHSL